MQDTFLAPLAHNCNNYVKTRNELFAVLSINPSTSFSFILYFLYLSILLYNSASILRLLSLFFFLIFLSLSLIIF
jgi:hypothetical protein